MDEAQLATDPWIGIELDGRYRIRQKLGEGGMGVVYKAEHILIEKAVAVKILRAEFAKKQDLLARFHQEARSASRIRHENIVDITDFGKTPEGSAYFVMEYLEGIDLAGLIEKGPIPYTRAIPIVGQVCSALSAAHEAGIIHRDLKPENIFLSSQHEVDDFVKILDFGIAKISNLAASGEEGERLTKPGMIFGTPEYMSPEQAGGSDLDRRVDIYALGVIFFEMLTGDVPFRDSSFMGVLRQHLMSPVPSVCERVKGIPPVIDEIIQKALAKHPEDRFQTMLEFWGALEAGLPEVTGSRRIRFESSPGIVSDSDSGRRRSISPPQMKGLSERERMMSPPPDASGQRRFSPIPRLESPPTMLREAGSSSVGDSKQRPNAFSTSTRSSPPLRSGGYGVVKPGGTSRATPPPRPAFTSGAYQVSPKTPAPGSQQRGASLPSGGYRIPNTGTSLPSGGYRVIAKGGGPGPSLPSGGYRTPGASSKTPSFTSGGYRIPTASPSSSLPSGGYRTAGAGAPALSSRRAGASAAAQEESAAQGERVPPSTLLLEKPPSTPLLSQPQRTQETSSLADDDEAPTQMGPLELLEKTVDLSAAAAIKQVYPALDAPLANGRDGGGIGQSSGGLPGSRPLDTPSLDDIQDAPTRIALNPTGEQPIVSPQPQEGNSVEELPTRIAAVPASVVPASPAPAPFAGSPEPAPFTGAPPPEFAPPPEIRPAPEASAPPAINAGKLQAAAVPAVAPASPSRGGRIFLIAAITTLVLGGGSIAAYLLLWAPSKTASVPEPTAVAQSLPSETPPAISANTEAPPPAKEQPETQEAASSPTSAPVPEPIPPPTEEPPPPVEIEQSFSINIPVSPETAKIYLGKKLLGSQGTIKLRGKEGDKVKLLVKASGYKTSSVVVVLGETTQTPKVTLSKIERETTTSGCNGPILNPFGCD